METHNEPILYALSIFKNAAQQTTGVKATLVERGTLPLDRLACKIERSTHLHHGTVKSVLVAIAEFGFRYLQAGYRLDLGPLGKLHPTIDAQSVQRLEQWSTKKIRRVNIRFLPSHELRDTMRQATFERTLAKTMVDAAWEAAKASLKNELG